MSQIKVFCDSYLTTSGQSKHFPDMLSQKFDICGFNSQNFLFDIDHSVSG